MLRQLASAAYRNAYLLLVLNMLFWSGNFVLGRGVHEHIPPIALSWWRWLMAGIIIAPIAWPYVRRDWPVIKNHLPILFFLGAVGVGSFNSLAYLGLNYTTAINALVVQSSGPVLIALASYVLFRDQLTWGQVAGIAISLVGVLVVIVQGDFGVLATLALNMGDGLILTAMAFWALYTAFLRKRPDIHWLSYTAVTFWIGALVVTPFYIFEHVAVRQIQPTMTTLLAVSYVAIFPGLLAYVFFNRGVQLIGSTRAGVFMHLVPLFGTVLSIGLLGEQLRLFHLTGFALILAGVWLASQKPPA
ncbi:S-adenosylmethionine/S-adenosylhomocysteine transporter [bacterium MnTg02]|nr:S-adenosylmethionine/S-adenosylhomocysteine transporter [bacterium MnTg02]